MILVTDKGPHHSIWLFVFMHYVSFLETSVSFEKEIFLPIPDRSHKSSLVYVGADSWPCPPER